MQPTAKADGTPTALVSFGLTLVMYSAYNAGLCPLTPPILGMGLFVGGLMQIIIGIMEFFNGNTFGMTMFLSYGLYWEIIVAGWLLPLFKLAQTPDNISTGYFMMTWMTLTIVLAISAWPINRLICFFLCFLGLMYFTLGLHQFLLSSVTQTIAGVIGMVGGILAMYIGYADILNIAWERDIFPTYARKKDA